MIHSDWLSFWDLRQRSFHSYPKAPFQLFITPQAIPISVPDRLLLVVKKEIRLAFTPSVLQTNTSKDEWNPKPQLLTTILGQVERTHFPSWFLERSKVFSCLQAQCSWEGNMTNWFPESFNDSKAWKKNRQKLENQGVCISTRATG